MVKIKLTLAKLKTLYAANKWRLETADKSTTPLAVQVMSDFDTMLDILVTKKKPCTLSLSSFMCHSFLTMWITQPMTAEHGAVVNEVIEAIDKVYNVKYMV